MTSKRGLQLIRQALWGKPPEEEEDFAPFRRVDFEKEAEQADHHTQFNREEILASDRCGCGECLEIFDPTEITEWFDNDQTALCPKCGGENVLGSESGFPITRSYLRALRKMWFKLPY